MAASTQESRVNVLLRLMGLIFFSLGASLSYLTYIESAQGNVVPEIAPLFYLVAGILVVSGLLAAVIKYK